jgi:hypothetical protein
MKAASVSRQGTEIKGRCGTDESDWKLKGESEKKLKAQS